MYVFIVRYYGGVHLGKRRLEIAEYLTEKVVKLHTSKMASLKRKSQRQLSQTSIASAVSSLGDEQQESGDPVVIGVA